MRAGAPSTAVKAPRTFAPRSDRGRPACRRLVAVVRARSDATGSCQRSAERLRETRGRHVAALPPPLAVPGHGDERVDRWSRHDVCNEVREHLREVAPPALLPRRHDRPRTRVVDQRSPGTGEREAAARALDAASDRPRPRTAAALARRAAQSGRERRGTARTAAAPAPRSRRSVGAERARGGPSTDTTADAVTRTCPLRAGFVSLSRARRQRASRAAPGVPARGRRAP